MHEELVSEAFEKDFGSSHLPLGGGIQSTLKSVRVQRWLYAMRLLALHGSRGGAAGGGLQASENFAWVEAALQRRWRAQIEARDGKPAGVPDHPGEPRGEPSHELAVLQAHGLLPGSARFARLAIRRPGGWRWIWSTTRHSASSKARAQGLPAECLDEVAAQQAIRWKGNSAWVPLILEGRCLAILHAGPWRAEDWTDLAKRAPAAEQLAEFGMRWSSAIFGPRETPAPRQCHFNASEPKPDDGGLPYWSASFVQWFLEILAIAQRGVDLLLVGEPGSGVLAMRRRVLWGLRRMANVPHGSGSAITRVGTCECLCDPNPWGALRAALQRWESRGRPVHVRWVPSLRHRREEIGAWLQHWGAPICGPSANGPASRVLPGSEPANSHPAKSGSRAPVPPAWWITFWRQEWPGNLPQMRSLWTSLGMATHGKPSESDLEDLCALRGLPFQHRIPSKNPDHLTLAAALQSTRTRTGRWNKRRAAQLLGWDPDTLVARMREFGLDDSESLACSPWDSHAVMRAMQSGAREMDC